MIHESVYELRKSVAERVRSQRNGSGCRCGKLRKQDIDVLVRDAVFGAKPVKDYALVDLGSGPGARRTPASVHDSYISALTTGGSDRTVPAMNIRFTTYDTARRLPPAEDECRRLCLRDRSEMGYTDQEPMEYSAALIAAAIKEGYKGPIFIQGDHFQVKASTFKKDPEGAIKEVKDLIAQAIPAGFWNIDIDTSTLVTLEPETLDEQQHDNYTRRADQVGARPGA